MMSHLVNFLLLQITKIVDNQSARSSGKISRPDELFRLFRKLLAEHYRHEHTIAFMRTGFMCPVLIFQGLYVRFLERQ